jgi:transcription elongation factor GreA
MNDAPLYISKEGLERLKEELHHLKTVKRREVTARIEKAKELGDLRENAEYHDAKDEAAFVDGRILEIEDALNRAHIIQEGVKTDSVAIGSRVRVAHDGKEKAFTIVGAAESDPLKGYISNESPTGRSLIGKKIGETAEVTVPAGVIRYTIVSIE